MVWELISTCLFPTTAVRRAGMLLENDLSTLTPLLTDSDRTELTGRIDEATGVILQAAAEMSATTSEVIADSVEKQTSVTVETDYENCCEEVLAAGSVGSPRQPSPSPTNWQPMMQMQAPLSPPHTAQHQVVSDASQSQQLPADTSSWTAQEALTCK